MGATGCAELGVPLRPPLPVPAVPCPFVTPHPLFGSVPARPWHRLGEPQPAAAAQPRGARGAAPAPRNGRYRLHSGPVLCNRRSPRARPGPLRSPPRPCRCHPAQPPALTSEGSEKAEDAEQRHGGGPVPPPAPGAVRGAGRALSEVLEPAAAAARAGRPRAGGGAGRCAGAVPCSGSVAVTAAVSGPGAAPASAPPRPGDTAEGSELPRPVAAPGSLRGASGAAEPRAGI